MSSCVIYGPPSPNRSFQRRICPTVEFLVRDKWTEYPLLEILLRILVSNPPDGASVMAYAMDHHGMEFQEEELDLLPKHLTDYLEKYSPRRHPSFVRFLYRRGLLNCVENLQDILYRNTSGEIFGAVISEEFDLEKYPTYIDDIKRGNDLLTMMRGMNYEIASFVHEMATTSISGCVLEIPGHLSWELEGEPERTLTFLLCRRRALYGNEQLRGVPPEMWREIIKHVSVYDILIRKNPLK